jgi:hypothetical protein
MKQKIYWLTINTAWLAVVYAATFLNLIGAYYVATFIVILGVVAAMLVMANEQFAKEQGKKPCAFGKKTEIMFDLFVACWLIWFGFWALGAFYFLSNSILYGIKDDNWHDN